MKAIIFLLVLFCAVAIAGDEPNYRDEFFSWVWMPCMHQLAENQGATGEDVFRAALELHSVMQGPSATTFNTQAWETEKVVTGMSVEERAKSYRYLRNECAGGYVASDYLPSWELGKPPF